MHRVAVLALPKVVAFDLAIPGQIFGHIEERRNYSFTTCSLVAGPVPSTTGYSIEAQHGLDGIAGADTVVVPGYQPHDVPVPEVLDALRDAVSRGARVISVCTGAFALAAAGLLDGSRATTHWQDADQLARMYPLIDVDPNVLYVDTGRVMTSAGVAAGIDLCLHLVRADLGSEAAARIARRMVVAPHRDGGQAQYLQRPVPSSGQGLASTCEWARERLQQNVTVAAMAEHAGWAPRTFARRFVAETGTTPLRWLAAQRVLEARRLLETTELSVDHVARRSGLGTAANLRLHLARDADSTPTGYRRAYRGRASM